MITIRRQSAVKTQMPTIIQRLADFRAAYTCLTSAARINFHEHAPGAFSLVREHGKKVRPSGIINTLSEHSARESFDIEIFDSNKAVLIDDLARFFVVKITALIAHMVVKPLKKQDCLTSTVRFSLPTCDTSLQSSQLGLCGLEPSGIFDYGSIAERSEQRKANVDANSVNVTEQRLGLTLDYEESKPSSRFAFNRQSSHRSLKWTVHSNLNLADFRQSQFIADQCLPDLSECHAVITPGGSKTWITGIPSV